MKLLIEGKIRVMKYDGLARDTCLANADNLRNKSD